MTLTKNAGGLQELATSSLPALGRDPLMPSWSRSLPELVAANQALIGTSGPSQPTAAAQVLLGSHNRAAFSSLASLTEAPPHSSSTAAKSAVPVTLEERCRLHRNEIIERILEKEKAHSQRAFEKAIERRRDEDWAKEREWWMKEIVGKRNLVDSTNALDLRPLESSALPMHPGPTTSNLLPGYASSTNQTLNTRLVEEHGIAVKSLSDAASSDLVAVLTHMESIASSLDSPSENAGYASAWQLLVSMAPRLSASSSPIDGALGSLIHFCKQYHALIKNRVASANLAGQDLSSWQNFGSGVAGTIAAFVKLEKGSNASIWHILYYCLRCGDAVAARDALNVGTVQEHFLEQALVQRVIGHLAQLQRNASCVWETGNPFISRQENAAMEDLYEKTRSLEPNNTFKIGVLALLSGNELDSFDTIEDYLFGRLWLALQSDNPTPEIEKIGASIRKYGPEYFGGAEESGGWGYALPLLATQQFRTVLTFLAEAGGPTGLLQSTHLGLILSMGKIALEDVGRPLSATGDLVTTLLVKYATTLQNNPALVRVSLQYLLRIPSKERSHKEIAELLCRSPHLIELLVGNLNDDGTRRPGELEQEQYLNGSEVDAVLCNAAKNFRLNAQDRSKADLAAKLFMLAGDYSSLISLLNELITPADKDDDSKSYWLDQSQKFHSHYLSQRTPVLTSLERGNNMKLVSTNRALMDFRHFFLICRQDKHQEAFEMIRRLNLFPLRQEEINEKESNYKDLDPILKDQIPALLTGAVHCLHGMHRHIKSEARGVDETVEFHLKDLQKKARFLYIFSGLTSVPNSTKQDIQRLRNNMV